MLVFLYNGCEHVVLNAIAGTLNTDRVNNLIRETLCDKAVVLFVLLGNAIFSRNTLSFIQGCCEWLRAKCDRLIDQHKSDDLSVAD